MTRGFNTAVSGLNAARTGLFVTGHNMANTSTIGYTRQQTINNDFMYQGIGGNKQVGLGVDTTMIRQIRNKYLDVNFRNEVGRSNYYNTQYAVGHEIENIMGELQSQYSTQLITQDVWSSLNELTTHPSGKETRGTFVSTANSYITKMNNIYDRLKKEQSNINDDIKDIVTRVNQLTTKIQEMNVKIATAEASGQRANDFRDDRNLCIDELSRYIKIEYSENAKGEVSVYTNGNELVSNGWVNKIGFRYTGSNTSFIEPVFTRESGTLPYDPTGKNAKPLFNYSGVISTENNNDYGELFSLIVARGLYPVDHTSFTKLDSSFLGGTYGTPPTVTGVTYTPPGVPRPPIPTAGPKDPTFLTNYKNWVTAMDASLAAVTSNPAFATATQAEQDAFNAYVDEFQAHKQQFTEFSWAAAYSVDMDYPPAIPENNVPVTAFTLNPAMVAIYESIHGVGTYATDLAQANTALTAMPLPSTPMGVYDPAYIQAVHDTLNDPDLKGFMDKLDALFADSTAKLDASYNQQIADYKIFKNDIKTYDADMTRLTTELSAQPINAAMVYFNATQCSIPKALRQLDDLFNYTINLINDELSKGVDLNDVNSQTKVFVTKDGSSRFTLGNVMVNPDLMDPEGYNLLCLNGGNGVDDGKHAVDLLAKWSEKNLRIDGSQLMNIEEAYTYIVNEIGVKANKDYSFFTSQMKLVDEIDNKRQQVSGVSLDEEMSNMMIYQHAFNASSRVINVIDSMLDKLINGTGRVGL